VNAPVEVESEEGKLPALIRLSPIEFHQRALFLRELETKLKSFHRSYQKRCREILTLVHDIDFLAALIQNSIGTLEDLSHQAGGSSAAMIVATALDIAAGGKATEQAKMTSYISGYLDKKLTTAKERALAVKLRLMEMDGIFTNLLDQIKEKRTTRSNVDALVSRRAPILLAGITRNQVAPYAMANSQSLEALSAKLAEKIR